MDAQATATAKDPLTCGRGRMYTEQDHRSVKQRVAVTLGFKRFRNAAITIAVVELMHRIRKGQFALERLGVQGRAAPAVWSAALGT